MFYRVTTAGFFFIKNRIEKLNRIAEKLKQEPIQFELILKEKERDPQTQQTVIWYTIQCIGEAPKLKDWHFVATLDFTPKGNLVNACSDKFKVPKRFLSTPMTLCEDCHEKRKRNNVFVLFNEKENKWMQVGSSCLSSFLGVEGKQVHELAELATTLANMPKKLNEWDTKAKTKRAEEKYSGFDKQDICTAIAFFMDDSPEGMEKKKKLGVRHSLYNYVPWIVKGSYYAGMIPTAIKESNPGHLMIALDMMNFIGNYREVMEKKRFLSSNNVKNICTVIDNEIVAPKHFKYLNMALSEYYAKYRKEKQDKYQVERQEARVKYEKELAERIKAQTATMKKLPTPAPSNLSVATASANGFVGQVGSNVTGTFKVFKSSACVGRFGAFTANTLVDSNGNSVVFFGKGKTLTVGASINVSGIVKEHKVYKNTKQTVLAKVKI